MTIRDEEIATLRQRIKQNEQFIAEMEWARSLSGDPAIQSTPDIAEVKLKSENDHLHQLIAQLEQKNPPTSNSEKSTSPIRSILETVSSTIGL